MPAITPARLKIQATQLAESFGNPIEFVAKLHNLLDFYADRTRKPGRGGPRMAQIRAYNVPKQVVRQIESLLTPRVAADEAAALALADSLWAEPWLECRLIGLYILGSVSLNPPDRIIDRIKIWGEECGVDPQLDSSLATGLVQLRREAPARFFSLLESWIQNPKSATRRLGLRVIPPLVSEPAFVNLPVIFNLLLPLMQKEDLITDADLMQAISALAKRTPKETAYFLKQSLSLSNQPGMDVFIRRILDSFPEQDRDEIRAYLRQRAENLRE
jgi:hypothetical protein